MFILILVSAVTAVSLTLLAHGEHYQHDEGTSSLADSLAAQAAEENSQRSGMSFEDLLGLRERDLRSSAPSGCKYDLHKLTPYQLNWRDEVDYYWGDLSLQRRAEQDHGQLSANFHEHERRRSRPSRSASNSTVLRFRPNRLPKSFEKACDTTRRRLALNFFINGFPKNKKRWVGGCTGHKDGVEFANINVYDCNGTKILCDGFSQSFILKHRTDIVISMTTTSPRRPLDFMFYYGKRKPFFLYCDYYPGGN